MKIKALKGLTTVQERTYQGLAEISELISGLYLDAVMIMRKECMLQAKVNLVAHCAREIDGALRDIFAPKEEKKKIEKTLSGEEKGHQASILVALGNTDKGVAAEWLDIATKFAGLAHRHYAWASLRDFSEIEHLWHRYEKILSLLAGSVYAIRDRIDQLTSLDVPNEAIIGALKNLNRGEKNEYQFFRTLDKTGWFQPLDQAGLFDVHSVEAVYDHRGRWVLSDWLPLSYFARIAPNADAEQEKRIVEIIDSLKHEALTDQVVLDDACMYNIYRIIAGLPTYRFNESDKKLLDKYNHNYPSARYPMHESIVSETLTERYVKEKDGGALTILLAYCFGFYNYEEKVEGLEEHGIYANNRVEPNIGSFAFPHMADAYLSEIVALTGPELPQQLAGIINKLEGVRSYELNSLPSVEHSEQSEYYIHDWVSNLAEFLRASSELLPEEQLLAFIPNLLKSPALYLQRLALHLIRLNYPVAGQLFWKWLGARPLEGHFPIHELYLLLQEISPSLSPDELKTVLDWFESMHYDPLQYSVAEAERFKAHRVRSYLTAIKVTGAQQTELLKGIQNKYDAIDQWPVEHPEFDSYSSSSMGYDIPVAQDEFEKLSAAEQANYVNKFEPDGRHDTNPRGLAILLEQNIIRDTDKYKAALDQIISVKELYLAMVISGFTYAVKNGTLSYREDFREKLAARVLKDSTDPHTLTAFAGFLMEVADRHEKLALTAQEIERCMELLVQILETTKFQTPEPIPLNDFSNQRLNGLYGKAFDALALFNKLWNKVSDKKEIHPIFKAYLEKHLQRTSEMEKEFSIGIGFHFPYFLSIDPQWAGDNAAGIFPRESRLHMDYTLGSLFSPINEVYKNVLVYFAKYGLNEYVVERYQVAGAELNRVSRYALVELFYIDHKAIEKEGTLISLLIRAKLPVQLQSVITVAAKQEFVAAAPVLDLWSQIQLTALSDENTYGPVLEQISSLAFLSQLEKPVLELLGKSISYLKAGPLANKLVGLLARKPEIPAEQSAKLILEVWKTTGDRVWVSDDLTRFVEKLYSQDKKSFADDICIHAAEHGDYRLKTIYDRFQVSAITGPPDDSGKS